MSECVPLIVFDPQPTTEHSNELYTLPPLTPPQEVLATLKSSNVPSKFNTPSTHTCTVTTVNMIPVV